MKPRGHKPLVKMSQDWAQAKSSWDFVVFFGPIEIDGVIRLVNTFFDGHQVGQLGLLLPTSEGYDFLRPQPGVALMYSIFYISQISFRFNSSDRSLRPRTLTKSYQIAVVFVLNNNFY